MVCGQPIGHPGAWQGCGHICGAAIMGGGIIIAAPCAHPEGHDGGMHGFGHIDGAEAMVCGHPIGQEGA